MKKKISSEVLKSISKAKEKSFAFYGSVAAYLTSLNNKDFSWQEIDRIVNATKSHSIKGVEFVNKLPGELENFGNAAVEAYLKGGDKLGKHWSHIKSQKNSPELSSDTTNAILEDGTVNIIRGAENMTMLERIEASIDNHIDGFKAIYTTSEFWERTLGNAFEAGIYAMALTALDQVLINREMLINGSNDERRDLILDILKKSGLLGAGTLPVSVFLGVCLMLFPGLAAVLGPIGLLGTCGIGIRLIKSASENPTKQEKIVMFKLRSFLKDKIYQNNIFNNLNKGY